MQLETGSAGEAHIESELARAKALRAEAIALRDQGDKRGALTKARPHPSPHQGARGHGGWA